MSDFFPFSGGSGYVQLAQVTESSAVYFGFVGTLSPTDMDIQEMGSALQRQSAGSYVLQQTGGPDFPCFAFPASFVQPSQFIFGGFLYSMQASTVTIGGVLYDVYLNPTSTYAPSMNWTVS